MRNYFRKQLNLYMNQKKSSLPCSSNFNVYKKVAALLCVKMRVASSTYKMSQIEEQGYPVCGTDAQEEEDHRSLAENRG